MQPPLGLIVFGHDHFLIRGPLPAAATALELVRRWIFPGVEDLLGMKPPLTQWHITTREFREDIEWAIVMERVEAPSEAVAQLLREVEARGVPVQRIPGLQI